MRQEIEFDWRTESDFARRARRALGGFAREIAARLVYVDLKLEAGKLTQRITKGTLRATEAWTHGLHADHDKNVELDHEPAVALANATEGAARSTESLKWSQVMGSCADPFSLCPAR